VLFFRTNYYGKLFNVCYRNHRVGRHRGAGHQRNVSVKKLVGIAAYFNLSSTLWA
jgi:hypothetical protein